MDLITKGINKLTGLELKTNADIRAETGRAALGSSEQYRDVLAPFMSEAEPQTGMQRVARRVGQEVGAGAPFAPITAGVNAARAGTNIAIDVASDIGAGLGGQAAREYLPDSVAAEWVASFAGAVTVGGAGFAASRIADNITYRKAVIRAARETPTVKMLKERAGILYTQAQVSGTTATPTQVDMFNNDIIAIAIDEGLITPKGRTTSGFPKVNGAIKILADYVGNPMTPVQMRRVRKALTKVAGSVDPDEARVGVKMLKSFDTFSSPLMPEIADANRLYTSAMRGDSIEMAIELAAIRAGQFSGSGFENALRTEFRTLSSKITKRQIKGLSPEQIAAIKKVANGGPIENLWRNLGKAAPTGVVSVAAAGGMPYMIADSIWGPGAGLTAAGVTMSAGAVSRRVATRMQTTNAATASALMRGMALPRKRQDLASMQAALATWVAQNTPVVTGEQ